MKRKLEIFLGPLFYSICANEKSPRWQYWTIFVFLFLFTQMTRIMPLKLSRMKASKPFRVRMSLGSPIQGSGLKVLRLLINDHLVKTLTLTLIR